MAFSGRELNKKRRLLWSMLFLLGIVIVAGIGTKAVTEYLHSRNPIYQCIKNPLLEHYQLTVPISVSVDGTSALVPLGVGITSGCTLPVHTLQENVVHVAYHEYYPFTLGHFLYNWIGHDLTKYETTVYVNGILHSSGSFLNIPLENEDFVRIEFTTRK